MVLIAKASPQNVRLWVSTGGVTVPVQSPPPSPPLQGGALAFLSSLKPRLAMRVHDPRAHRHKGLQYAEEAVDQDYSAEDPQDPEQRGMGFGQVRDGHTGGGLDDE